jgi:hypothetical protein
VKSFEHGGEASYRALLSPRDSPAEVSIGGEGVGFIPEIGISKWGGSQLGIRHRGSGRGRIRENNAELHGECGDFSHSYRLLDEERFEFDIILASPPENAQVDFELEIPEGLEFHRQPYRAKRGASIPEEVRGSYAVYGNKSNNGYKTGKFCHIYRPRIIDARGRQVWGRLEVEGGILSVHIPKAWLERASYPVTVDPTIGTSSVGSIRDNFVMEDAEYSGPNLPLIPMETCQG